MDCHNGEHQIKFIVFFCEGEAARLFRRTEDSVTQDELLRAKPKNKIYPVLDSLNALAATPWKINEPVGPVKTKNKYASKTMYYRLKFI